MPAAVEHEVMAETAAMEHDRHTAQILDIMDEDRVRLGRHHAVSEQADDFASIVGKLVMEGCCHTQHQVGAPGLEVFQRFVRWLELYDERNVQLFEQQIQHVDIIALRLALVIKVHVGPQVTGVLIDQRMFTGVGTCRGR